MIYEIGFNTLGEYEGEDGKIHKIQEFKELCEYNLKEDLSEEQQKNLLNIFIKKNKEKLINQNIPIKDLVIIKHNDINFDEMMNNFKGGGLKWIIL